MDFKKEFFELFVCSNLHCTFMRLVLEGGIIGVYFRMSCMDDDCKVVCMTVSDCLRAVDQLIKTEIGMVAAQVVALLDFLLIILCDWHTGRDF